MDQNLAEAERQPTETEKLHSSLSPYTLDPDVKDYEYADLGVPSTGPDYRDKKRFRLLKLMSGFLDSPTVYCKILEVEVNIAKDEVCIVQDLERARSGPPSSTHISYEALSWRWGNETEDDHAIIIKTKDGDRKKRVSYTLGLALKYLRYQTKPRMIWIDALCINQANFDERSSQVAMMDRLYTGASQICVWLGQDDFDSRKAIKFIKEEINELRDFDKLCKTPRHAEKWRALLGLMQRDWFSRRWVVQELALARKAVVYCGPDEIEWRELAIAIELFVEVESATHRLSELMKKDERFSVIPNWFEHISELGASLLVTETSKIFRDYKRESDQRPLGLSHLSVRGPGRRSLLSLEYLVTSLSIFDCGRPHDFVYALVTISRDAFPSPPTSITKRSKESLVTEVMKGFVERKPFPLDYDIPYPDVARDFIEFTIQRHVDTGKDEEKALDILCRPWSKDWRPEDEQTQDQIHDAHKKQRLFDQGKAREWKIISDRDRKSGLYKFKHAPSSARQNPDKRTMAQWWVDAKRFGDMIISEESYKEKWKPWFPTQKLEPQTEKQVAGNPGGTTRASAIPSKTKALDVHLPSWVSDVTKAPFDIFPHPGVEMTKMGRKNADPLVGSLDNRAGTYSAAQSKKQNSKEIKFQKRGSLDHYSLYVRGFRFDKVDIVEQVSQQGAIPASWLKLGGWERAIRPKSPGADPGIPPDALWRTLVADRGMHNQNPPYYYSRACRETIMKGALRSNAVDTAALIYNERNSIIAEFCRRTQCVVWNRAMIRTENGYLGLVAPGVRKGDLVCIIYGCTVPVILRRAKRLKTGEDRRNEMKDDCLESFKRCFKKCLQRRARKFEYQRRQQEDVAQSAGIGKSGRQNFGNGPEHEDESVSDHAIQVRNELSLWKAKVQAQRMLNAGIEKSDLHCWLHEHQGNTGDLNIEDLQRKIHAKLQDWTAGHPWQNQCDALAKGIDALEEEAKSAMGKWKQRAGSKERILNGKVRKWLKSRPSKSNKITVDEWIEKMPAATAQADSEPMWRWLGDTNQHLNPDDFNNDAIQALSKWWNKRQDIFQSVGGQPAITINDRLEEDIKEWSEVKRYLDAVVKSREERTTTEKEQQMKNELEDWVKKMEDRRQESGKRKTTRDSQEETRPKRERKSEDGTKEGEDSEKKSDDWENTKDLEKQSENLETKEDVGMNSETRAEGGRTKRWSQLPSKSEMGLKLARKGKTHPDSEQFSSDDESDEDSEDETKDSDIQSVDAEEQQSDSDPDDEDANEGPENNEKRENTTRRLGKKERQALADQRDPFRHYTFLGEAYIHGMMEGEAVSQGFYKKKPEHLFELR